METKNNKRSESCKSTANLEALNSVLVTYFFLCFFVAIILLLLL